MHKIHSYLYLFIIWVFLLIDYRIISFCYLIRSFIRFNNSIFFLPRYHLVSFHFNSISVSRLCVYIRFVAFIHSFPFRLLSSFLAGFLPQHSSPFPNCIRVHIKFFLHCVYRNRFYNTHSCCEWLCVYVCVCIYARNTIILYKYKWYIIWSIIIMFLFLTLLLSRSRCSDSTSGNGIIISVYIFSHLFRFLLFAQWHAHADAFGFGFVFSQLNSGSLYRKNINISHFKFFTPPPLPVTHRLSFDFPTFSHSFFVIFFCHTLLWIPMQVQCVYFCLCTNENTNNTHTENSVQSHCRFFISFWICRWIVCVCVCVILSICMYINIYKFVLALAQRQCLALCWFVSSFLQPFKSYRFENSLQRNW